jgi:hypothetical protein
LASIACGNAFLAAGLSNKRLLDMNQKPSRLKRGLAISACAAVVAIAGAGEEAQAVEQMEKYCLASWRNARIMQQDWSDCTQQTIAELLERVPRERLVRAIDDNESEERRELNRTIWRVIQRCRRAPKLQSLSGEGPAAAETNDPRALDSLLSDDQRSDAAGKAIQSLAPLGDVELGSAIAAAGLKGRQERILVAWSQGRKVAEIAAELGMTPARVSDEKYKAIQTLRRLLGAAA